jgi:hypothetical protein
MPDYSAFEGFIAKRVAVWVANTALGVKAIGATSLFHSGELGGWVDPDRFDGYTYNPANGNWYGSPPDPFHGSFDWFDSADPAKASDLDSRRNDAIHRNEIENGRPWTDPEPESITGLIEIVKAWTWVIQNAIETGKWPNGTPIVSKTIGNTPDPLVKTIKYVPYVDPLILDLDGDGLEITRLNGIDSIKFDTNGDGVKTATAWPPASE